MYRYLELTLLIVAIRCCTGQFPTAAENVTEVLDQLLHNYRKELRPGFGGAALFIETDMMIRSMGQISESEMGYSFQCYFRQRWFDHRLTFNIHNITEVTLNNLFLSLIWKPNTYFLNGHRSHQHNITVPNLFVRIRNDGRVYLSRRLTIEASCPMKLRQYPMDKPVCPLILGSYGFTTDDIVYQWKYGNDRSVEVNNDVTMAMFDLMTVTTRNLTEKTPFGDFSVLEVYISFKRHIGYFVLQTYIPCSMITCLSWVSFWINRDAAPARVLLGVTTILATAGIGMTVREGLPRVSYATALDMYLNVCVVYEMAAMIEYAAVNYFTKIMPIEGDTHSDVGEPEVDTDKQSNAKTEAYTVFSMDGHDGSITNHVGNHCTYYPAAKRRTFIECFIMFMRCLTGNRKYRTQLKANVGSGARNSVSRIDIWSRYIFPISFIMFNFIYWLYYMVLS